MKGNCCACRARSVERIVTTAGETRLTRSAYEVWIPATATGAGCEGWEPVRLINLFCPLHEANEKTTRTKLKTMFARESAPLKFFTSFISLDLHLWMQ